MKLKNSIIELKNSLEGLNSRTERFAEMIQSEE